MDFGQSRIGDGAFGESGGLGYLVSGWLKKRGPTHTYSWRPRWCVLTSHELVSYRDPQLQTRVSTVPLSSRAQVFRISELLAPGEALRHKREKPYGFVLDADPGAGKDRRLEYFDAGDASTLEAWILGVASAAQSQAVSGGESLGNGHKQVLSATHLESELVLASTGSAGDAYLARHGIPTLFNEWAAMLAKEQPKDPFSYMWARLTELSPNSTPPASNGGHVAGGLRFSDNVELLAAASMAAGTARRDLRQRVSTGYIREDDGGAPLGPRFNDEVEELAAASYASGGPSKQVRTRVNTGFVRTEDLPDESGRQPKGLSFNDNVEEVDAASASSGAGRAAIRQRVNTGFVRDEETQAAQQSAGPKGLRFNTDVEELAAASQSSGGTAKQVRTRVNTGFIRSEDLPEDSGRQRKGLSFNESVEEVDAASASSGRGGAAIRQRVNTGFVREEDVPTTAQPSAGPKGLRFNTDVEELAAASQSSGASGKQVRTRVNTGFVRSEDLPEDSGRQRKGLSFNDNVEEVDAASASSGAGSAALRQRMNTGFVREEETQQQGTGSKGLQSLRFNTDVEELAAASQSSGGTGKQVRTRVNTGFIRSEDLPEDSGPQRKGLSFNDNVEEVDAASASTGTGGAAIRQRVNTGFVREEDVPRQDGPRKGLQFAEEPSSGGSGKAGLRFAQEVEEGDAASEATGGPKRNIRTRVNTGFAFEEPAAEGNGKAGLRFAEQVEEADAASESTGGPKRNIRTRVNTGFAFDQDLPSPEADQRKALQFASTAPEELEAASESTGDALKRNIRARVNTGYAFSSDLPKDDTGEKRSLTFAAHPEEVEAATQAVQGHARNLRDRVSTGYVFEKSQQKGPASVKITDSVEVGDAASEASGEPARSIRNRVNTGYAFDKDVPSTSPTQSRVNLADGAEVLEAASAAADVARSIRDRVGTGYIRQEDAQGASPVRDQRPLKFNNEVEELDAASSATDGPKRSVRARVNTGYAFSKDLPEGASTAKKGLQFSNEVQELDAASAASAGPRRSIRARVNTGFAFEAPQTDSEPASPTPEKDKPKRARVAEGDAQVLEAASEAADGPARSIRSRVLTGFAFEPKTRPGLQFQEQVEEVEAASEAAEGGRSIRTRVNTGFIFNQAPEEDSPVAAPPPRKGLRFNDEPEQLEAASTATEGGAARGIRSRVATGFAHSTPEDEDDGNAAETPVERGSQGGPPMMAKTSSAGSIVKSPILIRDSSGGSTTRSAGSRASTLSFSDTVVELEAASEFGEVRRSVRSRMNTSFAFDEEASSDSEEDYYFEGEEEEEEETDEESEGGGEMGHTDSRTIASERAQRRMCSRQSRGTASRSPRDSYRSGSTLRSSMLRRRLSSGQEQRKSLRLSVHKTSSDVRRKLHHERGVSEAAPDGPEAQLDAKLVENAPKDEALLTASLRPLALFDDLENEVLADLISLMQVYEFQDQEEVLRQGDMGGTHFYVVACGAFEIVKDSKVVDEIGLGATFGESVLLIDGHRTATVRAKGYARVYGLEAQDVRDALHLHYEQEHKEVLLAIDKILASDNCEQFQHLNAFQLHALFSGAEVRQFKSGEVIRHEGRGNCDEVFVLTQGAVTLRTAGVDLSRVPRCTMFGMRGMLFGYTNKAAIADGSVKALTIPRSVLEEIFDAKKLALTIMKPEILRSLNANEQLQHKLDDDQREALAGCFEVLEVRKNRPFKSVDARMVMGLDAGGFEASRDGFRSDVQEHEGSINELIGIETLLDSSLAWDIQLRPTADRTHVAVWTSNDVNSVLAKDVTKDRVRCMRGIFLFRTLTQEQLRKLASSMVSVKLSDGEAVFNQGDAGDTFCIIAAGRVVIERNGRYIRALSKGDYFGERALLTMEPRSASVKASGPLEIWAISRDTFTETMSQHAIDYLKGRFALQDSEYTFDDLIFRRVIGTGGFGVVKMVETKQGSRYAMKCVQKQHVVERKQTSMLLNERMVLQEIDHPFIVKLVQTFRNDAFVYFLMELVCGGELLEVLNSLGVLNKQQAHFYTGSIILALEHLHDRRIAYLDLKSENILIDEQGYIKLVDFGLAVKLVGAQNHQVRGTPHFMAPEMILSKGYDTTADLWTLGICLYEFMIGRFPFGHACTKKSEIFNAVLKAPLVFPEDFQQKSYAEESMSFIRGLLDRRPTKRIGGGIEGYLAFKVHQFFLGFDWDGLLGRKVKPPYEPTKEIYAEGSEDLQNTSLAGVEAEAEKAALANGWCDPEPGWDDDFSS